MMQPVIDIAQTVLMDRLLGNKSPLTHKSKLGLGLTALAGLLVVAVVGFLLASLYMWLTVYFVPHLAALYCAGILTFVSCALIVCALGVKKYQRHKYEKKLRQTEQEVEHIVSTASETLLQELDELVSESPKTAMVISAIAGFVTADKSL